MEGENAKEEESRTEEHHAVGSVAGFRAKLAGHGVERGSGISAGACNHCNSRMGPKRTGERRDRGGGDDGLDRMAGWTG